MSESLKINGEESAEKTEGSHLEVLTEMSDKFDPDKAKSLAAKNAEKPKPEPEGAEPLSTIPEKQEKELSPQEAADEYLSLLDELSQDFTYPYYSNSKEFRGQSHYANNITTELGRKYSDNPHYRAQRGRVTDTEAGDNDGTMLRIASADCILANEIGWRTEGKKAQEKAERINEQLDKNIAQLDDEYAKKGKIGKLFGKRKYEKARKKLEQSKSSGGVDVATHRGYNNNIAKELAISYNETGYYDYDGVDHGESKNEERNRHFFGLDNPERAKKVERAIELRQKYESEWSKKK